MTGKVTTKGIFVTFPVVSVSKNEQTNEKIVDRFDINVVADEVIGVNSLDKTSQQVTEDVRSIVYFRPTSGMRPILSSAEADEIIAVVNELLE